MTRAYAPPPPWARHAACITTNPDLFFPRGKAHTGYAVARDICNACPVRLPCLDYALAHHERFGMWGGATPRERLHIARLRARRAVS